MPDFNLKKSKALKKTITGKLMAIAWNPKRWFNFSMPEGEKKNRNNFYWVIIFVCISSIQFGSIATWSENYALGLDIFLIISTR